MIAEDRVFEMRGVWAAAVDNKVNHQWIKAYEKSGVICIDPVSYTAFMNTDSARRLAAQLNALARRIERRTVPSAAEAAEKKAKGK